MSCTIWLPRISAGRALDDLAAVVHHRHVAGDGERDVHVVLDQDQRHVLREAEQQLRQPLALTEREARCGLVEQHQLRLDGARHPHLELALLAVGEVADERVGLVAEENALGSGARALSDDAVLLVGNDPQTPAVATDDREKDVVLDREAGEEAGLLIRPREAELRPDPGGEVRDVAPHHLDRSRRRRKVARDEVEERRLAGPVRAEDRAAFAVRDVEIDVAYGLNSAEAPADPPQAEDRLGSVGWLAHAATAVTRLLDDRWGDDAVLDDLDLALPGRLLLHARRLRAAGRRAGLLEQATERLVDVRHVSRRPRCRCCRQRS